MEPEKKKKVKEEKKEEPKDISGHELNRDMLMDRQIKTVKGRTAYTPMDKSLKTKIIDPDSEEKVLKDNPPDQGDVFKEKLYICKKCGKGYQTPHGALECYDRDYEYGAAVRVPKGFKVK